MEQIEYYKQAVGQLFDDRYRLEKLVGIGGMAVVYKAVDTQTGTVVAIKKLKDELSSDKDAQDRFFNEAKAFSALKHPNIVGIYESCVDKPEKYLVMEFVDGISLRTYMDRKGALPYEEVVFYSEQILAALEFAHNAGVIHRDIKPQNIMVQKNGYVKITDFGIAKVPGAETTVLDENAIGTVFYISPEQAGGDVCDNRSDLYSLGVMMYEMATGQLPFYDEKAAVVLLMQLNDKPLPPRQINKKIPRGLETLILCAMEKDPRKRYQSALDMFRELRKLKKTKYATILTPGQVKAKKRSEINRAKNAPSRSMTPVILGIAVAVLCVAIVAGFTALDRLKIGNLASVSINVTGVVGKTFLSESELGSADEYKKQLEELGLDKDYNISVDYVFSDVVEEGIIIKQVPSEGSSRKTPCDITLTVSMGPQTVILEDYSGLSWGEARTQLLREGFTVSEVSEENPIVDGGLIIRTEPAVGSIVKKGSKITLVISGNGGSGSLEMPDYTGFNEKDVVTMMKDENLSVGNVTYTRSSKAAGTVIWQSPAKDSVIFRGASIDFVVSGGPGFGFNFYPDFSGQDATQIKALLEVMGCTVKIRNVTSKEPAGTIVGQTPIANTQTDATKEITLSVSYGGDYSTEIQMFSVEGMSVSEARLYLNGAFGTKAAVSFIEVIVRNEAPSGTVVGQYPSAGQKVVVSDGILEIRLDVSDGVGPAEETTVSDPETHSPDDTSAPDETSAPADTTGPESTSSPETTTSPEVTTLPDSTTSEPETQQVPS